MASDAQRAADVAGTLLVVGGRTDTVRKAVGLGLDVVLLQHMDHFAVEAARLARGVIIADYTDWMTIRPLVIAAHEAFGFTKVVSLTEPGLDPAGRINDLFALGGNPHRVSVLLRDKLAMRRHLADLGGPAAAANVPAAAALDEESLYAFGHEHGYPFVVKPADASASVGVHRVDRPGQIPAVWQAVTALRGRTDLPWAAFFPIGPHLVERYVDGTEYSVEAFSFNGRHVVVAITEKLSDPRGFIELGHAQPARVDDAAESTLIECTEMFLDAVGLREGASHTEIKLTTEGPKIIEGHNRIGGDRIVDLLELAYGVDFELLTVGWPFGLCEALPERPKASRAAATRFLVSPPGTVHEITGADVVRNHPDVVALDLAVEPGSAIRRSSNFDRCGQIVVVAEETAAAVELCAALAGQITISVRAAGR